MACESSRVATKVHECGLIRPSCRDHFIYLHAQSRLFSSWQPEYLTAKTAHPIAYTFQGHDLITMRNLTTGIACSVQHRRHESRGSILSRDTISFSSPKRQDRSLGPTQPPMQRAPGALSSEVEWAHLQHTTYLQLVPRQGTTRHAAGPNCFVVILYVYHRAFLRIRE